MQSQASLPSSENDDSSPAAPGGGAAGLRLLSVCETARGGVGRYQENVLALARAGVDPWVLLPEADRDMLDEPLRLRSFRGGTRGPLALLRLVRAFLREKRQLVPDIILFNSSFSLLPLAVMRLLGDRRPAIYCAHCWAATGRPARHWKTKLIARTEGWLCGLADVVVNVSSSDAETARRRGYRGTHIVVENAVGPASDTARDNVFSRDSEDEIHLLFVGRFDRQKGLDLLLPAFDEARQRNPDLRLHLVGGAVRDPGLPALPARAINHGWTLPDEIDSYYLSADALILPSRWEGMPLVALEALRNGTPVLASEPAALGDVLEDYEAGLTFQLSKARLTETLVRLNRATLREMRANARAGYAARFTQDRFVNGFSTVLADLAQARDV